MRSRMNSWLAATLVTVVALSGANQVVSAGQVPSVEASLVSHLSQSHLTQFGSGMPSNRVPGRGLEAIQVVNDPESGGTVWFLVNGQETSLKPGDSLDLPNEQMQSVEFNTGGPAGDKQFSLYEGTYKFKVTDEGWALYKSSGMMNSARTAETRALPPGTPHPPMPAEDLRIRRVSRRPDDNSSSAPVRQAAPRDTSSDSNDPPRNETPADSDRNSIPQRRSGDIPEPPAPGRRTENP